MYEFNVTLNQPFDQAMSTVREALMAEHLGVVSEVDVQAIFKNKLNKEVPPYRILGACNPKLADRVIAAEPNAGTLLPCNFVLRALDDERTQVSFMDPVPVLGLSEAEELQKVAAEAKAILLRVVGRLQAE
jgi:uncharacterized protein (DUF302 family)